METKLFKESESWGDTSGSGADLNFAARKKIKAKKSKKLKRKHSEIEEADQEAGKWVRAPKYYGLEESEDEKTESPIKLKRKERKRKHKSDDEEVTESKIKKPNSNNNTVDDTKLSYQEQLRESLKGSRFRFINEQLYTQTSQAAMKIFEEDETAYPAYHEGYRHQISQWPLNPLDRIIKQIDKLPKSHVVVDMGCGDARLSKSITQKVYSIDLVSNVDGVIKADMSKVPLDSNSVHVIVYCLSLMGTNLKDFFLEANRLLKHNGVIKIAEVSSRFDNQVNKFVDFVKKCGFELVHQDLTQNLFYFFTFKKSHDVNSINKKVPNFSLKPCLYKKR